jgi:ubiquinone/menaquinone biosynthesis C-methylase UbiE
MIVEIMQPSTTFESYGKQIKCFELGAGNIDHETVASFGEEWKQYHSFDQQEITKLGNMYFDIVDPQMLGKEKTGIDFGCGSGRWTKYVCRKLGTVAAVDPSQAIVAASLVLKDESNVQLYQASIENLPFPDDHFDFGFSLGVLHHIPDTSKAMADCVRKIKAGGHFLVYLYYNLDNKGFVYKTIFHLSNFMRRMISKLPQKIKSGVCTTLAIGLYVPFVTISRTARLIGLPKKIREHIPLHGYEETSFYVMKNDALDRFGTPLEQRFSKKEIEQMMLKAGLTDIRFSDSIPYWHAVGRKAGWPSIDF